MSEIWFTADTHFAHENILRHCHRPFSCGEEMDTVLIERWNELVKLEDVIYHLGDFAWWHYADIEKFFNALRGKKHLVIGNHDRWEAMRRLGWRWIEKQIGLTIDGQYVFLNHYAMRTWNASFHGSWHLFGHSHGVLPPLGRSFDVGVDAWDFRPINFETVRILMRRLTDELPEKNPDKTKWKGHLLLKL